MEQTIAKPIFQWLKEYHKNTLDACMDHFDPKLGRIRPYGRRILDSRTDENPLYRGLLIFANGDTLQEDLEARLFLDRDAILDGVYDVSTPSRFMSVLNDGSENHNPGEWGEDYVFLLNSPAGTMQKIKRVNNSFKDDDVVRLQPGQSAPLSSAQHLDDKAAQHDEDTAFLIASSMTFGGPMGFMPYVPPQLFLTPHTNTKSNGMQNGKIHLRPSYDQLPQEFLAVYENGDGEPYTSRDMRGYIGSKTEIALLVPQVLPSVKSYMIKRTPWPLGIGPIVQSGAEGVERIYHFEAESSLSNSADLDSPKTWRIYGIETHFKNVDGKVIKDHDAMKELLFTVRPATSEGQTPYVIQQDFATKDFYVVEGLPEDEHKFTEGYLTKPDARQLHPSYPLASVAHAIPQSGCSEPRILHILRK